MWECRSAANTTDVQPSLWLVQKEMFHNQDRNSVSPTPAHISGLKFCSSPLAGAKPSLPWPTLPSNKHSRAGGGSFPCQMPNCCSLVPSVPSAMPEAEWELLSVPKLWAQLPERAQQELLRLLSFAGSCWHNFLRKNGVSKETPTLNAAQNCPVKSSQWLDLFPPPLPSDTTGKDYSLSPEGWERRF